MNNRQTSWSNLGSISTMTIFLNLQCSRIIILESGGADTGGYKRYGNFLSRKLPIRRFRKLFRHVRAFVDADWSHSASHLSKPVKFHGDISPQEALFMLYR